MVLKRFCGFSHILENAADENQIQSLKVFWKYIIWVSSRPDIFGNLH
jgi:hypothetical protein